MAITPSTNLILLKVPIEIDNNNQINFANKEVQFNYFNSLPKIVVDNFTYQRKDSVIRFPEHIDNLLEYNYVMYQNENYSDKWFYAFITSMQYVSDSMTYVSIKTDVYQTWQFNIAFKSSFVEREHVSNDSIGLHTVPEGLETGEYIVNSSQKLEVYNNFYIGLAVTRSFDNSGNLINSGGDLYNGLYSGYSYIVVKNFQKAQSLIYAYAQKGESEAIKIVFMTPDLFVENITWKNITVHLSTGDLAIEYGFINSGSSVFNASITNISKSNNLDSYIPKNNKLLCFPYQYINIDNNNGNCISLNYEDFSTNIIELSIDSCLTPSTSTKLSPEHYKKSEINYSESLILSKIPACAWENDVYTNWLTQNGLNIATNLFASATQIAGGVGLASTGAGSIAGASNITSGVNSLIGTLTSVYEHSFVPPSVEGNINGGDVNFSLGLSNPILYRMSIKREYAEIIDSFFSAYGYKINKYKVPELASRRNWNFVKTINANIEGFIPQADLQEIKDMFNNGLTIWHNASTFLDYSQNNDIV